MSKKRAFISGSLFIIGKDSMLQELRSVSTLAGKTILKFVILLKYVQQIVISQKSKKHEKLLGHAG